MYIYDWLVFLIFDPEHPFVATCDPYICAWAWLNISSMSITIWTPSTQFPLHFPLQPLCQRMYISYTVVHASAPAPPPFFFLRLLFFSSHTNSELVTQFVDCKSVTEPSVRSSGLKVKLNAKLPIYTTNKMEKKEKKTQKDTNKQKGEEWERVSRRDRQRESACICPLCVSVS